MMYRKAIYFITALQCIFLLGFGCIWLSNQRGGQKVKSVYEIKLNQIVLANKKETVMEINHRTGFKQRVLSCNVLVRQEPKKKISAQDYENLLRIVEAEASGEDTEGKLLVANVVLNRVEHESFPDSVTEVIFQKNKGVAQFSPVNNGRFWKVNVSEDTVEAVNRALDGEDISQGALYFVSRRYAKPDNMRWFDEKLDYLFTHGGHEFFKE